MCVCVFVCAHSLAPHPLLKHSHPTTFSGVIPERFEEAQNVRHCALSLVGEPIIYPEINRFLDLLHDEGVSSFLVSNAQVTSIPKYRHLDSDNQPRIFTGNDEGQRLGLETF